MTDIETIARAVLDGAARGDEAKVLAMHYLATRGPNDCTGLPCPHCGENLPRIDVQRDGDGAWAVRVADYVVGKKNLKALASLIGRFA